MKTYTDLYKFECDVQDKGWEIKPSFTPDLVVLTAYQNQQPVARIDVHMA